MFPRRLALPLAISTMALAPVVYSAETIRCDAKQSFCTVDSKRLIVGDDVVFYNSDEEIVARGVVDDMDGRKRTIVIQKRHGDISSSDRVERADVYSQKNTNAKVFRRPSRLSVGGSFGLTPINVASDATAYSGEAFGQYMWKRGILLTSRLHYFTASGVISTGEQRSEEGSYDISGASLLGGAGYRFFAKKPIALRISAEGGPVFVTTNTSTASYPEELDLAGDGLGYHLRGGADAILTSFGRIQPVASTAFSVINQAKATTVSIGLMMELE